MRNSAISVMYPTLSKLILPNGGKTDPRLQKVKTQVTHMSNATRYSTFLCILIVPYWCH